MLAILSAMLVMMESGSAPAAPRLDLSVVGAIAPADLGPAAVPQPPPEIPLRLGRALSDCDPVVAGIGPGTDRPPASQELLVCRAAILKHEPVGRAFLWLGDRTGVQAIFSTSRVVLNVRFAP
ncbi:MAG TPA: hypothetical protein VFI16_07915 [Anaeromyxobacteraceae bacterium]|nr:hypothetical protein [Anaeromyxobacteraceae bacterium]